MIIGFDGSRAFVKDRTGTENYSYQLLKNLSIIDTENSYLVYVRSDSKIALSEWPKNFTFVNINFKRLWTQAGLSLQTFKDKLDVLFIPAHTLPIIKNPKLKTVITVHDLGAEYLPKTHQIKQRLYLKYMTHRQLKSATKIIAVSQATKDDIIKRVGIEPKKIKVIYEGVDREVFKPAVNDALVNTLKQFKLKKKNYFLFVGTIQPRKNLVNLINGYDSYFGPFKDVPELVLAGGKGWLSDEIYSLPKILNLEDRVKFLGRVSDEELKALYTGAIALVFPSLFEGFGLPILEAFACNCPVICSKMSSLPEVAGDGAIYIEDPLDCNSIAYAMTQLLQRKDDKKLAEIDYKDSRSYKIDAKECKKWAQKGQLQLNNFSWEKAAKETLEVLEEANHD